MTVCEIFPHTMDYFILDEKEAEDVIFFICQMRDKGKNISSEPQKQQTEKRVYADQVNWY